MDVTYKQEATAKLRMNYKTVGLTKLLKIQINAVGYATTNDATTNYATTIECYSEQFLSIKSGCYNERWAG